jgi:hypothetical protein
MSTALMRSWGSRADTAVVDEPLYAYYLTRTGAGHPGRDEIIASQSADWRAVVADLTTGPLPDGRAVYYQKHMSHHLDPEVSRAALAPLRHAFLIRDPRELLASYARVRSRPSLDDLGMRQLAEIFKEFGGPVVDAWDLRAHPEAVLRGLCQALDVPFDPAMLSWAPGPQPIDGVWAPHWYEGVWRSTEFTAPGPAKPLPAGLRPLAERCQPYYQMLHQHRITGVAEASPRSPG